MSLPQKTREYRLAEKGSYKNLVIKEKEIQNPGPNEVLVKIHAVSLQYRDLAISLGLYPVDAVDVVPCSDMAGEVVAVGECVSNWKPGDRVCSNFATGYIYGDWTPEIMQTALGGQSEGVLTEYRSFPAHALVAIPSHLNYLEASTLPCAGLTAYVALHGSVPIKGGDTVLVLGTGGVSIFGLQFAVASGATVIATSSSNEKLKIAQKAGAKHLINYKTTPNWEAEVLKITNGCGVDHVIEVGGQGTLLKSISAARIGGYVHMIGFLSPDSEDSVAGLLRAFLSKTVTLRGVYVGSVAQFKDMLRLMKAQPEHTRPVIDKIFPFDQAVEAYAHLESQAHVGKVVIQVASNT